MKVKKYFFLIFCIMLILPIGVLALDENEAYIFNTGALEATEEQMEEAKKHSKFVDENGIHYIYNKSGLDITPEQMEEAKKYSKVIIGENGVVYPWTGGLEATEEQMEEAKKHKKPNPPRKIPSTGVMN